MSTRRYVLKRAADLGRTVAEARASSGLTQQELAERLGVDRSYLARLEAGHSVQLVERAFEALRILGVDLLAVQEVDDG